MATQKQIEPGMRGLTVDFWCMRKQDRKFVMGNLGCSLFNIIDTIVVGIVDAGQMDPLVTPHDDLGFVKQHSYAHLFQSGNHSNRIVIAQYAIDRVLQMRSHPS